MSISTALGGIRDAAKSNSIENNPKPADRKPNSIFNHIFKPILKKNGSVQSGGSISKPINEAAKTNNRDLMLWFV